MGNVACLTSKRGGNPGAVIRLITKISDIIADVAMDRDRKIYELSKKLEDLNEKIKAVEALETEIIELFTSCRGVAEHYDVVQFSIIDRHGSPIVEQAIVIPHIGDPLSDPHRAELLSLPHLKMLKLAHPVSKKSTFEEDILVGRNTNWNIVMTSHLILQISFSYCSPEHTSAR
ncbi:hypothetical protein DAPPUDRAFT_322943 [Daphnia pulex]|uniref:Uncharacterized protein n=1 Tax=Daphnia pulex TaxID=6669 RepID=E9GXD8_DAPPU|nr:hypothetical protein DAPPUDRAFT_322943 [Daphnia pulex]|eukprot:EFX75852.1 hypothetical protein DAPPUDRAFT_322943 [Daphnia pulex]